MPTISLRRFSDPDILKQIHKSHLIELLSPHQAFLKKRGFQLPTNTDDEIDYEALANIFMTPDADTPKLMDALFLIDEMSTKKAMDGLLASAKDNSIDLKLGPDPSPADVAVRLWLKDQSLFEEIHAENQLASPRSFLYFQTETYPVPNFDPPTHTALDKLAKEMDDWFEEKKRGRDCKVFAYPRDKECWFLVRHGQPIRREGNHGKSESIVYRPQQHDVLIYNTALGEIRIHTGSKGERKLYLKCFGKHLFHDEKFFPGEGKYTLDPLIRYGLNALSTQGVEDHIESVWLKEIEFGWGAEIEIRKAPSSDLFTTFQNRKFQFKETHSLRRAKFSIKFKDSKTPRSVTIQPTNKANYDRDHDSTIIETWLKLRGFINEGTTDNDTERSMADTETVAVT
jgi:hypothetical protein